MNRMGLSGSPWIVPRSTATGGVRPCGSEKHVRAPVYRSRTTSHTSDPYPRSYRIISMES